LLRQRDGRLGRRPQPEAAGALRPRRREDARPALREPGARVVASRFESARHARSIATVVDAFAVVPLLRAGLKLGLADALRTPHDAPALAARLGLEPDLVAGWARMLHAQGWLARRGEAYVLAGPFLWLLDAPEAASLTALLDQSVETIGPRLAALPELMKGAERPLFGAREEALRMAAI